jgi:cytochrome P450
VFPDPHAFNPERFDGEKSQPDRYSYLPFGGGPRICLGASFAMAEAVTVLASLIRAVDLELVAAELVWPVAKLGLRPRNGLPMIVRALS